MISLKPSSSSSFLFNSSNPHQKPTPIRSNFAVPNNYHSLFQYNHRKITTSSSFRIRADQSRRTFLTIEEAGLVEISGLSTHERFLCRLTISSLNLLKVIAEEEKCPIEELNAGKLCDWFLKDKLKREQNLESAVLQWDENDPLF